MVPISLQVDQSAFPTLFLKITKRKQHKLEIYGWFQDKFTYQESMGTDLTENMSEHYGRKDNLQHTSSLS